MSGPQDSDFVAVLFFFFNVQTSVLEGLDLKIFFFYLLLLGISQTKAGMCFCLMLSI